MDITPAGLAVGVVLALFLLSAGADVALPPAPRIPIHWGLNGQPNNLWPRRPALYLLPAASAGVFGMIMVLPGHPPLPALLFFSTIQILVQLVYLGAVFLWASRQPPGL